MSAPGWRTSLVVQGFDPGTRYTVPVVVGLVETAAGGVQLALRVGERGDLVIMPMQAAAQLIVNIRQVVDERIQITGERLGGDQP